MRLAGQSKHATTFDVLYMHSLGEVSENTKANESAISDPKREGDLHGSGRWISNSCVLLRRSLNIGFLLLFGGHLLTRGQLAVFGSRLSRRAFLLELLVLLLLIFSICRSLALVMPEDITYHASEQKGKDGSDDTGNNHYG